MQFSAIMVILLYRTVINGVFQYWVVNIEVSNMAGVYWYILNKWEGEKVVLENIAPRVQGGTDSVKYTSFSTDIT